MISQEHITAVYELVTAAQAIIDLYVSLDITTLMALPGFLYTSRAAYANYVLAKLYIAVTAAGNTYGVIIDATMIQMEESTRKLVTLSESVHAVDRDCAAARILRASKRMLEWYQLYTASLMPTPGASLAAAQPYVTENWNLQYTESAADFGLDALFTDPILDESIASPLHYPV